MPSETDIVYDTPSPAESVTADVDSLVGPRCGPGPLIAPPREFAENRHQLAGALGELVVDARRDLAIALTGEHSIGDHAVEPGTQLFSGDAGQDTLQLDKPAGAGGEIADDQQSPFVAHEIEGTGVR